MDLGLRGKTALVAASSQGLGFAVARELACEGASLILCSRNQESLRKAGDSIRKETGVKIIGVVADLLLPADVERVVSQGLAHFGKIDILVTNIGGPPAGKFEDLDRKLWEYSTRSILTSLLDLTSLVLPGI